MGHDRILKVARTLADLGGLDKISADKVLEAVQYRTLDPRESGSRGNRGQGNRGQVFSVAGLG